jgi:hypothetical protein
MSARIGLSGGLLLAVVMAGCQNNAATSSSPSTTGADEATERTGKQYVLDFSKSDNGGLYLGRFVNVAFTVDLDRAIREYEFTGPPMNHATPDLVQSNDLAGCSKQGKLALERAVRDLEAGHSAWVEHVDLEMIPGSSDEASFPPGVCFGYRQGGTWHWRFDIAPITYDASSDRLRARLLVDHGPIDAVKLVLDAEQGRMLPAVRISFSARPAEAPGP